MCNTFKTPCQKLERIQKYYKPIQPTVHQNNNEIFYSEIQPSIELENFVYCFWQLKTRKKLVENFTYRVVSDGCIDIFFEMNRPYENFIMGFCRKYTEFSIGKEFNYIGIRFLPSSLPILFNVNAKSLSNQSQNLENISFDFSNWISTEIKSDNSFEEVASKITDKLIRLIENKNTEIDPRFINSLYLIFQKHGYLDIEKDLSTGLSSRQLRRLFNFYIGTTAKSFSNVVRFQHILNAKPSIQSLKNNKLYLDIGFFDQAHFIKTFKTFYGVTPSEAFR